jgi:OmpA-OmpF porin, OOP family
MKNLRSNPAVAVTLVCLALCGPGWLLGSDSATPGNDPFANWYGRAGGPVGADAIGAVSRGAAPAPASAQVPWFGRAGTLDGTDAVEALSHLTVTPEALPPKAFDDWYGRAGGPLGIPSVTAQDHATPTVDAQKRDYVWEVFGPSMRSVATGNCVRVGMWMPEVGAPPCETQPQVAQRRQREAAEAKAARAQTPPEPAPKPAAADAPVARALPPQPEAASAPPPAPAAQALAPEPSPPAAKAPEPEAPPHITLDTETHFTFDKSQLRPAGQAKVDQLLAELAQRQYDAIVVTGHTDRIGRKAYNDTLSEQRAMSVKQYLARRGVDGKKIQARGVGAAEPVTSPDACEGLDRPKLIQCLAPDRRVELVVVGARTH